MSIGIFEPQFSETKRGVYTLNKRGSKAHLRGSVR
nr:MAG TPA: hypothetical protein [Herelleviridae sp.]